MAKRKVTIIDESRPATVEAEVAGDRVQLSPAAVERALGWHLKPQGLCKNDQCHPLGARADRIGDTGVDLAALAELLDRPLALDAVEGAACLGASARTRAAQLSTLEAPDFALPDLSGKVHRLSDHRGKKVLLVAYASW